VVFIGEEGSDIHDIERATDEDGQLGSELVVDGAGEKSEESEAGVQGNIGVLADLGVDHTTGTERVESIVHARAAEADDTHGDHLDQRRVPAETHRCFFVERRVKVGRRGGVEVWRRGEKVEVRR
jgi:hypothetical protein